MSFELGILLGLVLGGLIGRFLATGRGLKRTTKRKISTQIPAVSPDGAKDNETMKYTLVIRIDGQRKELPLSADDFNAVKNAKDQSFLLLGIEEKFDMVLENYAEYEHALLGIALHRMIHPDFAWSISIQDIHLVDRRIANLLTITRLYVDQVKQDLDELYSDTVIRTEFEKDLSREFDTNLGFRVVEALRNYVQHASLAVRFLSYPMSRDWDPASNEPSPDLRFSTVPSLDTEFLGRRSFKAETLKELRILGKSVPLTPFIRTHIECLGRVHEALRSRTASIAEQCEAVLTGIKSRTDSNLPGRDKGLLLAVEETEEGKLVSEVFVDNDQTVERRAALSRKNRMLDALSRRYVSGRVEVGGLQRRSDMGADRVRTPATSNETSG